MQALALTRSVPRRLCLQPSIALDLAGLRLLARAAQQQNRRYQTDRHDQERDDGHQVDETVLHSIERTHVAPTGKEDFCLPQLQSRSTGESPGAAQAAQSAHGGGLGEVTGASRWYTLSIEVALPA